MRTIFAEKNLRTTPGSDCALNTLDIIVMFKKALCAMHRSFLYVDLYLFVLSASITD